MSRWAASVFQVARLTDADALRRARLHIGASLLVLAYFGAVIVEGAVDRNLPLVCVASSGCLPLAAIALLARRGRLHAAQTATFVLLLIGTLAVLAVNGAVTVRLGIVLVGIIFLGLAVETWHALALTVFAILVVLATALVPAVHALSGLSPSTLPVWLTVERQIFLVTGLLLVFTRGFRRLLATLSRHTAELEAAHAVQLAAHERLERLVSERSKELERANADLAAFASAASHDLRAPLRHVSGFLEIFEEDNAELGLQRLAPLLEARELAASMVLKLDAIIVESRRSEAPPPDETD